MNRCLTCQSVLRSHRWPMTKGVTADRYTVVKCWDSWHTDPVGLREEKMKDLDSRILTLVKFFGSEDVAESTARVIAELTTGTRPHR